MTTEILAEIGPIRGIGTVDRDGDGRRKYARGMPPAGRHEECLAGVKGEANALRVAKQRKAVGVPIFDVVYFRDVWLPRAASTVHIRRLVGRERDIFLYALNLHQEG